MIHELLQELRRRGIQVRTGDSGPEVVAPPGALTAQLRGALLAHRDALVALLERTSVPETLLVPRPEARLEPFPLTDIQHAYWIGLTNAFALGGYTTHFYFELDGHGIDPDRLRTAIDRVVGRHDMLRAVVQPDGRQRILGEVPSFPLVVHDLRNLAPLEERSRLDDIRADMDHQVLDPGQWPMFDLRLSLRRDGRTRLHVSLSLLVLDAYSIDIVFDELRRYYEEPGLPANPADVTFRDFVQHDLATRDAPSYRAASDYWSARAGSLPPAPAIPLARRPAEITDARFTRHRSTVEPDLWTTICSRARERGLTPSALLLAVFSDILRLWCRQDTFTLNLTLFNRPPVHPQIDQIVGDFTSLVLLEVPVAAADSSFLDRARAVQAQLLDDLEHVRYSGIQVMRDRAQARSTADVTMPVVFTSALGITDASPSATSFFGRYGYGLSQTPHVWLDHQVFVDKGRLVSNWDSVDGLFPPGVVPQMASAFEQAVRSLADADAWSAKRLFAPVAADVLEQRRRVNTTGAPWPTRTLGDLVEESVSRNPNHLAVWDSGEEHSYAELARDARRVARRLQELGARPGELVAVVADKGYAQVVHAVGAVLSGAAYLPIDAAWPADRCGTLLAQGRCRIVLTTDTLARERDFGDREVVTPQDETVRALSADPVTCPSTPEDLAYVIFTSGSTGVPKGVMIEHRSAVNTIEDVNERFAIASSDRVLALSSLSFDLSVWDIFGLLAVGGGIVLPRSGGSDPGSWTGDVAEAGVTVWNSVPSLCQAWLVQSGEDPLRLRLRLRLAMLSGDWIPVSVPELLRRRVPGVSVVSLGGATEAAIWSVSYPITQTDPRWVRIPYGWPMRNQTLHVLDAGLEDCPEWVTGELFIGGLGVARGYWDDAPLTESRFCTHPRTGERLYRTGDLARYLPGGLVDLLGREDHQVKINGYRIELGEVSAAIGRAPGVADAVAVVDTHPVTQARQLVAYVTGAAHRAAQRGPSTVAAADPTWSARCEQAAQELTGRLEATGDAVRAFEQFWADVEDLAAAVQRRTVAASGVFSRPGATATTQDVCRALGADEGRRPLVGRWLTALVATGVLREHDGAFVAPEALDPEALARAVEQRCLSARVPDALGALWGYVRSCVDQQEALLAGSTNPLELLFPAGSWSVVHQLYAANPVSDALNRVVARFVAAAISDRSPERPLTVLEVGAGTCATTAAVLERVGAAPLEYTITDISTHFVARAEQRFAGRPGLHFATLDINEGAAPDRSPGRPYDLVIAANVLHDAADLPRTLRAIEGWLVPGGSLVAVEGTTNSAAQAVTTAFLEGFSAHGSREDVLLSPADWARELTDAGFVESRAVPEGGPASSALPQHVIVARAGRGTGDRGLDLDLVREHVATRLPAYLVPQRWVPLDTLPLNANGKVDRSALPRPEEPVGRGSTGPSTAAEGHVLAAWIATFARSDFGVTDNFFELGGDSLHALQVLATLRDQAGLSGEASDGLRLLFQNPTVAGFAEALTERGAL